MVFRVHHVVKRNGAKVLSALIRKALRVGIIKVDPKINDGKWYDLKKKIAVSKHHGLMGTSCYQTKLSKDSVGIDTYTIKCWHNQSRAKDQ